ncbi:MAG: chondroitinase-B domain-containing protein [Chitinophagaceae bacterium]
MRRVLLLKSFLFFAFPLLANTILVKNIEELKTANKKALPGDTILLQNGEWKDVVIKLSCNGTKNQPVTVRAQTPGKVLITGESRLSLGGSFIVVDGLYFTHGYAGDEPVINFRIDKNQLANNCRVTNTVINDFNNPKRMQENYWVSFSGKLNRLDHCSFNDKKNMGVLLAVILDDERSRENFHSIDHNYFGRRPPLASNGGEIIRVGVSQHCEFNSNTQIIDNFFEYCDGETEIISIKSCSNLVKGNVFKESQGGVVLRHGNYNTVENNVFLGNGKEGTGGVRVINKGQWVINNFFYRCRGVDFRSPLSIMNGIPNSPANRYVQVTDAVIMKNTFYECTPASFCEGSDTERTLPPSNVLLANNIFYTTKDSVIYRVYDDTKGFSFEDNEINKTILQPVFSGFTRTAFSMGKNKGAFVPVSLAKQEKQLPDSLQDQAWKRLHHFLSRKPGYTDPELLLATYYNATGKTGAYWYKKPATEKIKGAVLANCKTAADIYKQLEGTVPVRLKLSPGEYVLDKPFIISKTVQLSGDKKTRISFRTGALPALFIIAGKGNLSLDDLAIDGSQVGAVHFIASDSTGSSDHYNLSVKNCSLQGFNREIGCKDLFYAWKYMVADSIIIRNSHFSNIQCDGITMTDEKDNKGYYNVEKLVLDHNQFTSQQGVLLDIYRGGNDESTMGPSLVFSNNKVSDCNSEKNKALIRLYGTQRSLIEKNQFTNCNTGKALVHYEDIVRASHIFRYNFLQHSGDIQENKFVENRNNRVE